MDSETNQLLKQIIANQVVIFKRLEEIEYKIKGGSRSAPIKSYIQELTKEANKVLEYVDR